MIHRREHVRRRLQFTDEQRRRLAVKAKSVGTKWLSQIATIVTPDTLLAWHRKLTDAKGGPVKGLSNGDFRIIETVSSDKTIAESRD